MDYSITPTGTTPRGWRALDLQPLDAHQGPRDGYQSVRESHNMAPAVCISNGTQRHPYCRPIGGPVGFDSQRQRTRRTPVVITLPKHHGTHQKAQVRLAAPAVRRGGFGTCGWADVGRWNDSDAAPHWRGFQLEEYPAAFGRRRPTRMPSSNPWARSPDGRPSRTVPGQGTRTRDSLEERSSAAGWTGESPGLGNRQSGMDASEYAAAPLDPRADGPRAPYLGQGRLSRAEG